MKVRINEKESYEFDIPEEMDIDEFQFFVQRLNQLNKFISKDDVNVLSIPKPTQSKKVNQNNQFITSKGTPRVKANFRRIPHMTDRYEALRALKLHYWGNKEEKQAYAKKFNYDWDTLVKRMSKFKEKHNIKPREVGLFKFPVRASGMHGKEQFKTENPLTQRDLQIIYENDK